MIKEKLKGFKIEIRRQQKDKIFAEKRKEQQNINQVAIVVKQIYDTKLIKENFEILRQLFHNINQNLIEYSKGGSKGVFIDMGKIWNEAGDISYNPLGKEQNKFNQLTSQNFKKLILSLIDQATVLSKGKIKNEYWQISQHLLFEVSFMIGLLFKQPASLVTLFPFKSLQMFLSNEKPYQKQNQKIDEENMFERSLEIFETNLFYLKAKFNSLKYQVEEMMVLFLNIIHSITTVIEFSVTNNIHQKKGMEMSSKANSDQEKVIYLYNMLKSHNFENYLQNILEEIVSDEEQNEKLQDGDWKNEISVLISLISLTNRYLDLVKFVDVSTISSSLLTEVKKFSKFMLEQLSYEKELAFKQQKHERYPILRNNFFNIYQRVLFQLHSLTNQPQLFFTGQQVLQLCLELINFLIIQTDLQLIINKSYEPESLDYQRTNLEEFYFSVLIAEEDDKWMHFLEILICLELLVKNYEVTFEDISHNACEKDVEFNQKVVISLFQKLSDSIISISGYFYNERHIFMYSLVNLFVLWIQNSFPSHNFMWELLFWYEIAEILQKAIAQIEQSIKDSENIEFNLGKKKYRQTEQRPKNKLNSEIFKTLQQLRTLIDHVIQEANENDIEKKMEIYD